MNPAGFSSSDDTDDGPRTKRVARLSTCGKAPRKTLASRAIRKSPSSPYIEFAIPNTDQATYLYIPHELSYSKKGQVKLDYPSIFRPGHRFVQRKIPIFLKEPWFYPILIQLTSDGDIPQLRTMLLPHRNSNSLLIRQNTNHFISLIDKEIKKKRLHLILKYQNLHYKFSKTQMKLALFLRAFFQNVIEQFISIISAQNHENEKDEKVSRGLSIV